MCVCSSECVFATLSAFSRPLLLLFFLSISRSRSLLPPLKPHYQTATADRGERRRRRERDDVSSFSSSSPVGRRKPDDPLLEEKKRKRGGEGEGDGGRSGPYAYYGLFF